MATPQGTRRERREQARAERQEAEQRAAAAAARRRRLIQLGAILALAAVVVVVAIVVSSGGSGEPQTSPGEPIAGKDLAAEEFNGIPQQGAALGDPKAPYTMVEYGDLICPACKEFSDNILPPVIQQYVRTGKLRMELRLFGFVRDYSTPAAEYGWAAAAQDKLWPFSKIWYVNQGDENTNYVNDAFARRIASGVPGLDADRMVADAHKRSTREQLDVIARQFVTFGFQGTPSFAAGKTGGTLRPIDLGSTADTAKDAVAGLVSGGG